MERDPSLDDALYLVEAHAKTGCMHPEAAFDYAERMKGFDRDKMRRGWAYIAERIKAADKRRQSAA